MIKHITRTSRREVGATAQADRAPRIVKRTTTWISVILLALFALYFAYARYSLSKRGLTDFFDLLERRGYTPNADFSGVVRPGNVIQVAEGGADAKDRQLATPLVVAWSDKCFPGRNPRTLEFTLPETQGKSSAGFTLSGRSLARMMPSLNIESDAVAGYALTVENTRIQTFAKSDLSTEFSPSCVDALKTAIEGGDKVEWFRVVIEAVVADALTLEVQWKDNTSVEARKSVTDKAGTALAQTGIANGPLANDSGMKVGVTTNDERKTTISAKGLVIIAYRGRPIQPVLGP